MDLSLKLCEFLLKINAIKINLSDPFTLSSGKKSPIYCDTRKSLSHIKVRNFIADHFTTLIGEKFGGFDVVAGVATGGIPHGILTSYIINAPFIYVRSEAKEYGMKNAIEGDFSPGQRVVVVEDVVATGSSSLKAVDNLRNAGLDVVGMVSILDYGFPSTHNNFAKNKVSLFSLANSTALLNQALHSGVINDKEMFLISKWIESSGETIF